MCDVMILLLNFITMQFTCYKKSKMIADAEDLTIYELICASLGNHLRITQMHVASKIDSHYFWSNLLWS